MDAHMRNSSRCLAQQGYARPRKSANTVASTWPAGIAGPGNNTAGIAGRNGAGAECPRATSKGSALG